MPDSPHAVSVALPRWADVVAYEEKEPACRQALRAIYPRFGFNPLVAELAAEALAQHPGKGCSAWPYPTEQAARLARDHCLRKKPGAAISIVTVLGIPCLICEDKASANASEFWQHSGLGASSRQASAALGREPHPSAQVGETARAQLRARLASLYGCDPGSVALLPSGMAALHAGLAAATALRPGRPTLQLGFPYVDVLKLPQVVFAGGDLLLNAEPTQLAEQLDRCRPTAVIVELPSNPLLQCVDLISVAELAHRRGIPVIADDTIGSVLNIDVLQHADLVFSSLTKSFAGRGDILAGALVVSPSSSWGDQLQQQLSPLAAELADGDSIELEMASRDVGKRIPSLNRNCQALAEKLSAHPAIRRVNHPGDCPNFRALMRPQAGHGCLLSFELKGGLPAAKMVYDQLRVCKGPSLGTDFTLVCPYVLLAHYNELKWAESCEVPPHLLRVSVGLEAADDLWERFQSALESCTNAALNS